MATPTTTARERDGPVEATAQDDLFRLTARADQAVYHVNETIAMRATLTYTGTQPAFVAYGAAGGVVSFSLRQLDGPLHMEGASDDVCARHPMAPGSTQMVPFIKSGGFDPAASDGDFWSQYFADPLLHLPAGRWTMLASAAIYGPECGPPHHFLTASLEIEVRP